MAQGKASSGSDPTKPKIHVTPTGGMYVEADELMRSPEVRKAIKSMAQIAAFNSNTRTSETPSKEGSKTSADE